MAKKIALVLAILAVIGAIVGGVIFYNANNNYGLLTSRVIGHDFVATSETRLRISVNTIQLGKDLYPYFPENLPFPGWIPWDLPTLMPSVLPREIAVLGGADYRSNAFKLTVFINEQRGGPVMPQYLNNQVRVLNTFTAVNWEGAGFTLEERGILSAHGEIPLPLGLEETIAETWSLDPPGEPLTLEGGHMAEGVIDNRNGDIVTLIAGLAPVWDTSLEQLKNDRQVSMVFPFLNEIRDIRVAVDFTNLDTVLIQVHLNVPASIGGQLEFLLPVVLTKSGQELERQFGLTMTNENSWKPDEEIYASTITLSGTEEKLRAYFKQIIPTQPIAQ